MSYLHRISYIVLFLIFIISISLINISCSTLSEGKQVELYDAHRKYIQFIDDNQGYTLLSSNVDNEYVRTNAVILPVNYDTTPETSGISFGYFAFSPKGPKLFQKNNYIFYFYEHKGNFNPLGKKGIKINLENRFFSSIQLSGKEWRQFLADPRNKPIDLKYIQRNVTGGPAYFSGTIEAISTDPPIYIYESIKVTGYILEALIILPNEEEGISKILLEDAYYVNGYSVITGFDINGYDKLGYDFGGFAQNGHNKEGYDRDGNQFFGQLGNSGRTGFGILNYVNGDVFQGWFNNNEIDGNGIFYGADGSWYAGTFDKGQKIGLGVFSNLESMVLERWTNGERQIVTETVGQIVKPQGQWAFLGSENRNGLAHGSGNAMSLDPSSSSVISNGIFSKGELIKGTYITADSTAYEGSFSNGFLTNGRVLWPNGRMYSGELKNGQPHGEGVLTNNNGSQYEGSFFEGRPEGEGKLTYSNKDIYEGPFLNGLPHGMGIYRNYGGAVDRCEFFEGNRIDQAYQIRVANARAEEERRRQALADEERRKLEEEEERLRQEEDERRRRAQQPVQVEYNSWAKTSLDVLTKINKELNDYNSNFSYDSTSNSYSDDSDTGGSSNISETSRNSVYIPVVPTIHKNDFIVEAPPQELKNSSRNIKLTATNMEDSKQPLPRNRQEHTINYVGNLGYGFRMTKKYYTGDLEAGYDTEESAWRDIESSYRTLVFAKYQILIEFYPDHTAYIPDKNIEKTGTVQTN